MILDATTFELVLTPEVAIGIVQKELGRSGYKAIDISQIRLFYEPYWVFTFDVEGAQQPISGKTALNASSGDVNEFVPILLDRPLNKTKRTADNVESEVEPTSVDRKEVEKVAQARVAAQIGVKKDQVSVSAFQKIYVPFYKLWINVEGNPLKVEVDGCLGAPFGLEAVPKKQKNMDDSTRETLEKMKTPAGWADLAGKTADSVSSVLSGKPGTGSPNQQTVWLILIVIILLFLFFAIMPSGPNADITCSLNPQYLKTDFNLIVYKFQSVRPASGLNGTKYVEGACLIRNKANSDLMFQLPVKIRLDGKDTSMYVPTEGGFVRVVKGVGVPPLPAAEYDFRIEWPEDAGAKHTYEFINK